MRVLAILLIAFSLLNACSSAPRKQTTAPPQWLYHTPTNYPNNQWILGRGQGASLETAKERARAEIARYFKSRITANTYNNTSAQSSTRNDGNSSAQSAQQSYQTISSTTEITLKGVTIAYSYENPNADNIYSRFSALAVLSKPGTALRLKKQIQNIQKDVSYRIAHPNPDPLAQLHHIVHSLNALRLQNRLAQRLALLSPQQPLIAPAAEDVNRLQQALTDTTKKLSINLEVKCKNCHQTYNIARNALAKVGLYHSTNGVYRIKIKTVLDNIRTVNKNQFLRTGTLSARIVSHNKGITKGVAGCKWDLKRIAGTTLRLNKIVDNQISNILSVFFNNVFFTTKTNVCPI